MNSKLFILAFLLLLVACNEEKNKKAVADDDGTNKKSENTVEFDSIKRVNSSPTTINPIPTTVPVENKINEEDEFYRKRANTIKSYPDFLKNYFTNGSDISSVLRLQGNPDITEDIDENKTTWFYGDCEITISNDEVIKVINGKECLRYIPLVTLVGSSNKKARDVALRIMNTQYEKNKKKLRY